MIAADSKSYPYLALARRHGLDYGVVLGYADHCRKVLLRNRHGLQRDDYWEETATSCVMRHPVAYVVVSEIFDLMRETLRIKKECP